jgi:hypothetical protein
MQNQLQALLNNRFANNLQRSHHKTGKNLPMPKGAEHVILHQKQSDTGAE